MSAFDRDTALVTTAPGRWSADVPRGWFVGTGPNGGWIAAVLTRAMMLAVDDDARPPRSLTVHFLAAPAAGPVEVSATVERAGSTTSALSLRMEQDGQPVALALGVCATWREGQPGWADAAPPAFPAPEEALRIDPERTPVPDFWRNYDGRAAAGVPGSGEPGLVGGWIRTAEPRHRDPVLIAALTDAWMPVAFARLDEAAVVPTLDLTIHWRAPLSGADPHPWTQIAMRSTTAAGGVWEEDGELWSQDGVLLAQSRQLAIVRRPRR